jgi:hypothetical protein
MVDFHLRLLHLMGKPLRDVVEIFAEDIPPVFDPRIGFGGITRLDCGWPIEIEDCRSLPWPIQQ